MPLSTMLSHRSPRRDPVAHKTELLQTLEKLRNRRAELLSEASAQSSPETEKENESSIAENVIEKESQTVISVAGQDNLATEVILNDCMIASTTANADASSASQSSSSVNPALDPLMAAPMTTSPIPMTVPTSATGTNEQEESILQLAQPQAEDSKQLVPVTPNININANANANADTNTNTDTNADTNKSTKLESTTHQSTTSAQLAQPIPHTQKTDPEIQHDAEVLATARARIKRHIKLLHDYNAIRDVGQGLLGIVADQRGLRIVDVMEEFGAAVGD